jgi:uncharacterized protein
MYEIFKYLLLGLAVGMLSGLVGIGGGVVIVPALIYLFDYSIRNAQGTSLGVLILPVGIMGAYIFYKNGDVNIKASLIISAGYFLGSYFGANLNYQFDKILVERILGFVLILLGLKLLIKM